MIGIDTYRQRRRRLARLMGEGVAVIPTAPEHVRNRDSDYPYRFDSTFHYLTGFAEPEAVLVVIAGKRPRSLLFCREKHPERETWDGFRYGPQAAQQAFGFERAYPVAKLDAVLPKLLENRENLFFHLGADSAWDARVVGWLNRVRAQARNGIAAPAALRDVRVLLDDMRLVKDAGEIALMRRAAEISAAAHVRAMQATQPGAREYEIEAELLHEFRRHGAQAPAYSPIVASGANACTLHYVANDAPLKDGDLLLIDAGCELDGYAADITRTFPVNGRFSPVQKDVYQLVLAAQAAALAGIAPGRHWDEPHQAALRVLAQGGIDLGLCCGSLDEVLEKGAYKRFYMHKTGHWLGMDVHDVGTYKQGATWRTFEPGMTLTVEPGCYIRPADDVPKHFWNIGVRIEDDVVVTETSGEVLTHGAPKSVAAIEELFLSTKEK
jgi:Xaa-Pro aminopeptidase